jgi:hypothetical protein
MKRPKRGSLIYRLLDRVQLHLFCYSAKLKRWSEQLENFLGHDDGNC